MTLRVGYLTEEQFIAIVRASLESGLGGSFEPVITAGTAAQYWRGDKSWQTLDKAAVGLGNVDNTSDLAKPISTATQTALDAKLDDTQASAFGLTLIDDADADAARVTLNARPASFAFPLSGLYHDATQASYGAAATAAAVAGRVQLVPFVPSHDITPDNIGVNVTSAAAGNAKVVIYAAHATTGWPDALIVETADLDTSTTGYKSAAFSTTLKAGRLYWIGARFSATPTVSIVPQAGLRPLGRTGPASNPALSLNQARAYATAAENPFVMNSAYLVNTAPPAAFIHEP